MVDFKEHDRMSKELANKEPLKTFLITQVVRADVVYNITVKADSYDDVVEALSEGEIVCLKKDICYIDEQEILDCDVEEVGGKD